MGNFTQIFFFGGGAYPLETCFLKLSRNFVCHPRNRPYFTLSRKFVEIEMFSRAGFLAKIPSKNRMNNKVGKYLRCINRTLYRLMLLWFKKYYQKLVEFSIWHRKKSYAVYVIKMVTIFPTNTVWNAILRKTVTRHIITKCN
jgi:hypothetical protein